MFRPGLVSIFFKKILIILLLRAFSLDLQAEKGTSKVYIYRLIVQMKKLIFCFLYIQFQTLRIVKCNIFFYFVNCVVCGK
jgi:hypothetical protein